jgi:phosphoglycolate phosphatase
MIKAILLDFDGVLVRSNHLHARELQAELRRHGVYVTEKSLYQRFGEHPKAIFATYFRGPELEKIFRYYVKRTSADSFIKKIRPISGMKKTLQQLSKNYQLILVSGGIRTNLVRCTRKLGIAGYLNFIVSGDDVKRYKPHSDCLLLALRKAKLSKSEAIYVGDAPNDAKAAKNAGIKFIAVLTGVLKAGDAKKLKPFSVISDINHIKKTLEML